MIAPRVTAAFAALAMLALPAAALAAPKPPGQSPAASAGTLTQLPGKRGCLVDSSKSHGSCGTARALQGPGPFMGSRAIAISPDGDDVYVASSKSDAIAIFARNRKTGALRQPQGSAGCVAAKGASGCGTAVGLDGPNSLAISPDGRYLYATSRTANSVTIFRRSRSSGALAQLAPGVGCVAGVPLPGCAPGRALVGPDVVVVSPDGRNVYVGSFFGNEVAVFARDATNGALTQLSGTAGCLSTATTGGCTTALALEAPEGMAVSGDGSAVYVASALSNALLGFSRDPSTGALAQGTEGNGCIVDSPLGSCATGVQLAGANAVAVSPDDDDVYVTSLFSNSVTAFTRTSSPPTLAQKEGTAGCLIFLRAAGCSFGRALQAPEGLALSPHGANLYVAAFRSGAIDVLDRDGRTGKAVQKAGAAGCLAPRSVPGCRRGRALRGASSIVVSADGRYVYSTSFGSDAVDVFRRNR